MLSKASTLPVELWGPPPIVISAETTTAAGAFLLRVPWSNMRNYVLIHFVVLDLLGTLLILVTWTQIHTTC